MQRFRLSDSMAMCRHRDNYQITIYLISHLTLQWVSGWVQVMRIADIIRVKRTLTHAHTHKHTQLPHILTPTKRILNLIDACRLLWNGLNVPENGSASENTIDDNLLSPILQYLSFGLSFPPKVNWKRNHVNVDDRLNRFCAVRSIVWHGGHEWGAKGEWGVFYELSDKPAM